MWRTHCKAGEDVSSSSYADADHTVDPTETNRYCSDSDKKNTNKTLTSKQQEKCSLQLSHHRGQHFSQLVHGRVMVSVDR